MADENGTGNNLIWAITTIIVVAIIGYLVYFMVLKADSPSKKDIDIKISAPSR